MKVYDVLINGENCKLFFDGDLKRVGFYITKRVRAINIESAKESAIGAVIKDISLKSLDNGISNDDLNIIIEEIEEKAPDIEMKSYGYSFYAEGVE